MQEGGTRNGMPFIFYLFYFDGFPIPAAGVQPEVVEGVSEHVHRVTHEVNVGLLDMVQLLLKF